MPTLYEIAKEAIETARAIANDSKMLAEIAKAKGRTPGEIANKMLDELQARLDEAATKTVDGKSRPRGDFLVVEDPEKPTTWHLPVKRNGKPDHNLMGAAWAALHGGYRGNKYEGPNKAQALAKLKALYKSEDMDLPAGEVAEMDGEKVKAALMGIIKMLDGEGDEMDNSDGGDEETPEESGALEDYGTAVEVARDATAEDTASLTESEAAAVETGRRAPVVVDFQMIKPGPGNQRDNHYYPAEVLKRDAHVFEGADVFATDHRESERSERTKVGKVLSVPTRFTEDGAPVAQVLIYEPNQAEKARNRADANALSTLECSIFGSGKARRGKVGEQEYYIVEELTQGKYLELVSKAGAGGHALNLAENITGGADMTDEKKAGEASQVEETEPKEVDVAEGDKAKEEAPPETGGTQETASEQAEEKAPDTEPQTLDAEKVTELLAESKIPAALKETLKRGTYKDEDEAKAAIAEVEAEVKKLTGSGQPFGLGATTQSKQSLEESEQRLKERYAGIEQRYGVEPLYTKKNQEE